MGEPPSYERQTEKQYDRWIKKSLCNEQAEFFRELRRQASKQTLFSEMGEDQVEALEDSVAAEAFDIVDSEFQVLQYSVAVRDELLYDALTQIDERDRHVILMAFWLEMTDLEISDETGIPRSTVNAIKHRTYKNLKKILEDNGYDANTFFPKGNK